MSTDARVAQMLDGYESVIRRFVDGEISSDEFESTYLTIFKNDRNQVSSREFDILDGLFADVDDYVADPELRAKVGGLDDNGLKARAKKAYTDLYHT